jgi:hypothetical protein
LSVGVGIVGEVGVGVVDVATTAGARHEMDNGFGRGGFGGLGVAGLRVHYADAVEEKLGDVGHGHGVFARDTVVRDLGDEIGEEEIDGGRGAEIAGAVEECGGDRITGLAPFLRQGKAGVVAFSAPFLRQGKGGAFCFRVGMEGAERGAVRG